jgi:ferritin
MNSKLEKAINEQINFELYSAYIYMSMASYLKSLNLNGFSHWMEIQVKEELAHVIRFYNFVHERGGSVEFQAVPKPKATWESPLNVFEDALEHEKIVTSRINNLVDLAIVEKDHAANANFQWFITEQVEEEANAFAVIQQLKLAGNAMTNLFLLDKELGTRVFVDPNAKPATP